MRKYTPRKYQEAGLNLLLENNRFGLFYDMGLGKTVVALTAIKALLDDIQVTKVLVIAPLYVARSVWDAEAQEWEHTSGLIFSKVLGTVKERMAALSKPADIYLINRENVAWLCELYGGYKLPFDMVVIDELSSFRNHRSKRFKALKNATTFTPRLVGLTGTPSPKGYINLWAQIFLLDRGKRLGKTITEYRRRYFEPGYMNSSGIVYDYKVIPGRDKEILSRIKDITVSLKTEDCIELPPLTANYIKVQLPEDVMKQYQSFERERLMFIVEQEAAAGGGVYPTATLGEGFIPGPGGSMPGEGFIPGPGGSMPGEGFTPPLAIPVASAAALTNKLLQFSNGAVYDENHVAHAVHDYKLDALEELVEDLDGKPLLLAYAFQSDKERILKRLAKYKPRVFTGDAEYRDWNAGKISILLTHPASTGHGLNLQHGGSIACWFGVLNDLELYEQFNKRLHRPGQQNPVILHHIICPGTMDDTVVRALRKKCSTQSAVMEALKLKLQNYFAK
jgi:SNF2 family DNA or RNA helicase